MIQGFVNRAIGGMFYKIGTYEFKSGDLYYAIQKCTYYILGIKSKATKLWDVYVTITDTYDFDDPNRIFMYGLSLGNIANDMAWNMQKIGLITAYEWSVSYGTNFWRK